MYESRNDGPQEMCRKVLRRWPLAFPVVHGTLSGDFIECMSLMILASFCYAKRLVSHHLAQALRDTHVLQAVAYQWAN
jgi:hypothetical protein